METSIIIRTKNEEKWIGECLKRLNEQTYKDFEIIVIDSGSIDKTLEIVKMFQVKLFHMKQEEFSYPYALNFGCQQAKAEKYFVFLSGHSLPFSKTWLKEGLSNFTNNNVMGVYGPVWALPDGSILEKLIFNKIISFTRNIFKRRQIIKKARMGVMGFTNAIILRNLWEKHNFNEDYGNGGEDGEWSGYWLQRDYIAIKDIKFAVYHSHSLGLKALIKQWKYWESLSKPQSFKFPEFRE